MADKPKFQRGKVVELTEEELDGFTLDELRCRSCSGYGNCGYKMYRLMNDDVVSICTRRMKKLQCERDGIPFED